MLPNVVETIPQTQEILAKKAEGRPVTPEEYAALTQFVDRVERRTIQIKEEAVRAEEERAAAARAAVPMAAFEMPLEQANMKEHVFNILVEAGFETVGDLMFSLKTDPNKVLGLPGIGPKAMVSIDESLAALTFPEPVKAEEAPAPVAEVSAPAEPVAAEELLSAEKQAEVKKEAKKPVEEPEDENAKDGVSLDELFKMKPEIFQSTAETDEDADKKKGKKKKKSSVELVLDEERGEVVGRKKHKRGDETEEDW
jgi:N utilization substance protein A